VPTDFEATFAQVRVEVDGLVFGREAAFSSMDFLGYVWLHGMLSLAITFVMRISCCHFGQLGESGL